MSDIDLLPPEQPNPYGWHIVYNSAPLFQTSALMNFLLAALFILVISFNAMGLERTGIDFAGNKGQWSHNTLYKADIPGGSMILSRNGFLYSFYSTDDITEIHTLKLKGAEYKNVPLRGHAYRVVFSGGNRSPRIREQQKQSYFHNYFIGKDRSKWAMNVPVYRELVYEKLYPAIDLSVYSSDHSVKYDFIVHPGGNAANIRLRFDGVKPVINNNGSIDIVTSVNHVVEQAPYAFQLIHGKKMEVMCKYSLVDEYTIGFEFPRGYDKTKELIIDPTLVFSTYSGAAGENWGGCATYDLNGNLYATSQVSGSWISTPGAYHGTGGNFFSMGDIGINKYNASGSSLIYAAFFGGAERDDVIKLSVGAMGELILFGCTESPDLPSTSNCYDNTLNGTSDFFITKFNSAGSAIIGSTYLGGSFAEGALYGDIKEDAQGNVWGAGATHSPDFPLASGAQTLYSGAGDGVFFKLNTGFSSLMYSGFLGGNGLDQIMSIDFTASAQVVVSGKTSSTNFPTTPGVMNPLPLGMDDGFISIIDPTASAIVQSSYLGTPNNDHAYRVQVSPSGNIFVAGESTGNYPVSPGVYFNTNGTVFIHKMTPSLTSLLSTRIIPGGSVFSFMVNSCENLHLAAFTSAYTAPTTPGAFQSAPGEIYICRLGPDLSGLNYATYMGSMLGAAHSHGQADFDKTGNLYTTLCVQSFYTTPNAYDTIPSFGGHDGLSFKFHFDSLKSKAAIGTTGIDSGCAPLSVSFVNNSVGANNFEWDFGDGTSSTALTPVHIYNTPGTFIVRLVSFNSFDCNSYDTAYYQVRVNNSDTVREGLTKNICAPAPLLLSASSGYVSHQWQDGSTGSNLSVSVPGTYWVTSVKSCAVRIDTFYVGKINLSFDLGNDLTSCAPVLLNGPAGNYNYLWSSGDTTQHFTVTNTGSYWLALSTADCQSSDTILIELRENATSSADTFFCTGTSVDLVLEADAFPGSSTLWNDGSSLTSLTVVDTGKYWVTITGNNCHISDTTIVRYVLCDCTCSFPTAFSPDGNGKNDYFKMIVPEHCSINGYFLAVYNRWGQKIFSSRQRKDGWDGTFNGQNAPVGTYMFYAEVELGQKKVRHQYKGDITLLR